MRSDAILNQEKSLLHFRALLQFRSTSNCNNVITLLQLSLYENTFFVIHRSYYPIKIHFYIHVYTIFCNNLCLKMRSDAILNQEISLLHFRALLQFRSTRNCNNVITLLQLSLYENTFFVIHRSYCLIKIHFYIHVYTIFCK